jgi:hypothetical protein
MEEDRVWYLSDGNRYFGPLTWSEVVSWYRQGKLSRDTLVWMHGWAESAYLVRYFGEKTTSDVEASALIPSWYEILIYGGIILWCLNFLVIVMSPPLGILCQFICLGLEVYGLYLIRKNLEKSTVGLIGDIMVIFFIIGQVIITVFVIIFTVR